MNFIYGWDEKLYKDICKRSRSKQAAKDASYMRPITYHKQQKVYAVRIDNSACCFGYFTRAGLRIVCVAVDEAQKGKGLGSTLLLQAMQHCKENGICKITTRTKDGKNFYIKFGFNVVGMRGGDYIMEVEV